MDLRSGRFCLYSHTPKSLWTNALRHLNVWDAPPPYTISSWDNKIVDYVSSVSKSAILYQYKFTRMCPRSRAGRRRSILSSRLGSTWNFASKLEKATRDLLAPENSKNDVITKKGCTFGVPRSLATWIWCSDGQSSAFCLWVTAFSWLLSEIRPGISKNLVSPGKTGLRPGK